MRKVNKMPRIILIVHAFPIISPSNNGLWMRILSIPMLVIDHSPCINTIDKEIIPKSCGDNNRARTTVLPRNKAFVKKVWPAKKPAPFIANLESESGFISELFH